MHTPHPGEHNRILDRLSPADRVYVLEKGSVRFAGPAAELRDDAALRNKLLAL